MKKLITFIALMGILTIPAFATNVTKSADIHITYNGVEQAFTDVSGNTVLPLVSEGTTYLPIRAVSGLAGLGVVWEQETQTVTLTSGGTQTNYAGTPKASTESVDVTVSTDMKVTLDGVTQAFTNAGGEAVYPIVNSGTTYLPIRAVCGLAGIPVEWNQATQTVVLGTTTTQNVPVVLDRTEVFSGSGEDRYYTVQTCGYDYLHITMSGLSGSSGVWCEELEQLSSCGRSTEIYFDVSGLTTVSLENWYYYDDPATITSMTLERAAIIPPYSIPAGATALTDANTTMNADECGTYSNGRFILHNRAAVVGTVPDYIGFQNNGYKTLTYTLTTFDTPMGVNVYVPGSGTHQAVRQAANTTATYTADISTGTDWKIFVCYAGRTNDSILTNVYVQ